MFLAFFHSLEDTSQKKDNKYHIEEKINLLRQFYFKSDLISNYCVCFLFAKTKTTLSQIDVVFIKWFNLILSKFKLVCDKSCRRVDFYSFSRSFNVLKFWIKSIFEILLEEKAIKDFIQMLQVS